MPSTATLATLTDRAEQLLLDTTNAVFPALLINEGIRLALEEYSRARPLKAVGTLTVSSGGREQSMSGLSGLISVARVWFPYTASDPEDPPEWVDFTLFDSSGTLTLYVGGPDEPAVNDVIRVFYNKTHTLNGLDSANTTTFSAADDGLLVLGGAGYACLSRAADLNETASNMAVSTPNYAALANLLLTQFRDQLNNFASRGTLI